MKLYMKVSLHEKKLTKFSAAERCTRIMSCLLHELEADAEMVAEVEVVEHVDDVV